MKKQIIIILALLFSSGLFAQGIYNNGAKIVIDPGTFLNISGTGGNYLNATSVTDGAIALNGSLSIGGNYTNNVAANDILTSIGASAAIIFNGTTLQTLGGSTAANFVFNNLIVNNTAGISLSKNTNVNGMLTFTNGLVNIGINNLNLGTAASIGGTPSATSMIVATAAGKVNKMFSTTASFTFPVGDNNGNAKYSPVTLNFTSGTFAPGAYAAVNLVNAAYTDPNITGSYLNRYWNVSQTGISGYTCDAVFQYHSSDVVGIESSIYGTRVLPAPFVTYNPTNVSLHQFSASGLTSFGTFTGALGIKTLNIKLFFEGLYVSGGTMHQAYNALGPQFATGIADVVNVDLHDAVSFPTIHYTANNIQVSTTGNAIVQIPASYSGNYYLSFHHRNSIETVTSLAVNLSSGTLNYDFTTSATSAFGSNMKHLSDGKWALYGGDANGDGAIDGGDLIAVENEAFLFGSGYILTDVNGDGVIDGFDLILVENNAFNFISTITP